MDLPYFISGVTGIGGTLKERPEDFVVHEVPAYEPSGVGEHVMVEIEKSGLTTFEAIHSLAKRLGVPRRDIGYAGLKDARAVTRQWLTLRGTTPDAVADAATDRIKILFADRHANKLRVGHLRGNRFVIKVRRVDPMKVVTLTPALATLSRRGMPNYYGPQRFGRRDRNHVVGMAFARHDYDGALHALLGDPDPTDDEDEKTARESFDAGDLQTAYARWPQAGRDERAVLKRLRQGATPESALAAADVRVRDLWQSAVQSRLFNAVVARRIATIDRLVAGDLAYKHENGACFHVRDLEAEQLRADRFEISPTGPMVGLRMTLPIDEAAALEQSILTEAGLPVSVIAALYATTGERARAADVATLPGARRPLRVRPDELRAEAGIDEHGPYITVAFTLSAGAYATVLLRELMRTDTETRTAAAE